MLFLLFYLFMELYLYGVNLINNDHIRIIGVTIIIAYGMASAYFGVAGSFVNRLCWLCAAALFYFNVPRYSESITPMWMESGEPWATIVALLLFIGLPAAMLSSIFINTYRLYR